MESRIKQSLDSHITSLNMGDYIFEMTVPTEEVVEVRNNARKTITCYILPDYVLVRMELTGDSRTAAHHTLSMTGFVGHGRTSVPLNLDGIVSMLIPSIVAKITFGVSAAVARTKKRVEVVDFAIGDSVMMINGPFTEARATIIEINTN